MESAVAIVHAAVRYQQKVGIMELPTNCKMQPFDTLVAESANKVGRFSSKLLWKKSQLFRSQESTLNKSVSATVINHQIFPEQWENKSPVATKLTVNILPKTIAISKMAIVFL